LDTVGIDIASLQ